MHRSLKPKIIAGAVAGLAVAGGGAAVAATQFGSPKEESQAVLSDAAKQLGVTPNALNAALKKALENQVDDAVAAGRLTKEQGAELKKRIETGDVPLLGLPLLGPRAFPAFWPPEFGFFGTVDAAASYLGLTETQLESQLNDGKTLAQIGKERGKSIDGLVDALYTAEKKKLDDAVAAGELTKPREQAILTDLKARLRDFVQNAQLRLHRDDDHRPVATPNLPFNARSFGDLPGI
jgi:polyhydroxyalkanoate synthesis regulator phasin